MDGKESENRENEEFLEEFVGKKAIADSNFNQVGEGKVTLKEQFGGRERSTLEKRRSS